MTASRVGFASAWNSVAIPADRDQYFRDVVAALACRGWDTWRIIVDFAGRPSIRPATPPPAARWNLACKPY